MNVITTNDNDYTIIIIIIIVDVIQLLLLLRGLGRDDYRPGICVGEPPGDAPQTGGVGGEVSGDHFMISISIICDIVIMIVIVVIIY